MAVSGVAVEPTCIEEFNKIKLKKAYQYVQYKVSDDLQQIEVDKCVPAGGDRQANFTNFVDQLPSDDCRYAVYDFHYNMGDAGEREKLLFIVW